MKICSECDKINENVKGDFCIYCGGKLIEKDIETYDREKIDDIELKQGNIKKIDSNKKFKIIISVLIIIVFIISGLAIYFKVSDNSSELEKKNSSLNKQINILKEEKDKLVKENTSLTQTNLRNASKIDFLDKRIVFVLDGYGNYYYTYDQMQQVTQGKSSYMFWAYNIEQASDLGYKPWQ